MRRPAVRVQGRAGAFRPAADARSANTGDAAAADIFPKGEFKAMSNKAAKITVPTSSATAEEIAAQDERAKPQVREPKSYARPFAEIIADLSKPLPKRHLKTRKQGGAELTYIEWHTAVKYLDHYAPGWSYHVKSVELVGSLVAVIASISIPCQEGVITREATGCEDVDNRGYGDACSNAEAMAMKRAAAQFGLGLYLYAKGNHGEGQSGERQASAPADPRPKTLNDLVTPKQLWMIRSMAQEIGADAEKECRSLLNVSLEEISNRAASYLIDYLKSLGAAHASSSGASA